MIRDKLMEINQTEVWNSDKLSEQVAFIREFAVGFAEWLNFNFKFDFTDNAFKELLEIYENEIYKRSSQEIKR